ncbi:MAG: Rieske (2Fe-2S) protein [Chloroflexi bacterium]|nr:Rieske (2Fe-2S) protein [Chloroflexota bacterium]
MTQSVAHRSNTPVTRRGFIQLLLGFSVTATVIGMLTPVVAYLLPQGAKQGVGGPVEVGKPEEFASNTGKIVSVNDKPVIVVNSKAGGIKAFSAICTHLGCIVSWDARKNSIACPCHDGFFNAVTGAVISGPPPKPLAQYELVVKDGKVFVGKQIG